MPLCLDLGEVTWFGMLCSGWVVQEREYAVRA